MATTPLGFPDGSRIFTAVSALALNASGLGAAMIFLAPKTGTIDAIGAYFSAITSPPTYRVGLEGATTTRSPDGTYKASGSAYVDVTPTVGVAWRTLGASASVTAGDALAATIRYQTGTIGASNTATVGYGVSANAALGAHPFALTLSGGSWTVSAGTNPMLAVRYDDGTVVGVCASVTNASWGNGTTPLLRGNLYVPPVEMKCRGAIVAWRSTTAGAHVKVSLYDGTTLLTSQTLAQDVTQASLNPGVFEVRWPEQSLSAGGNYRFVIEPTTATAIARYDILDFADSTARDGFGASLLTGTVANTAGGAWTETSLRMYPIFPLISEVSSGGGGSVGVIGG